MSVRIGIFGAGFMGNNHARIVQQYLKQSQVVSLYDADSTRATNLADQVGARVAESAEVLVNDPQVDAIIVASPDETHATFVKMCVAAGKQVLCEKPLGLDAAECRSIVDSEMAAGRRLVQVAYMRRYDPGYVQMKRALDESKLGLPLFLHCIHRNAVAPSFITSETILTNAVVHEIDVGRFLLGEEFVSAVVATPRASRKAPSRNPQFVVLETASGVIVDVEAFLDAQYGYDVRAELVCEEGTMTLQPNPPVSIRSAGRDGFAVEPVWTDRFEAAYVGLLTDWIRSVGTGIAGGSSAWDGYAATLTADACFKSWKEKSQVRFDIPAKPGFYR